MKIPHFLHLTKKAAVICGFFSCISFVYIIIVQRNTRINDIYDTCEKSNQRNIEIKRNRVPLVADLCLAVICDIPDHCAEQIILFLC